MLKCVLVSALLLGARGFPGCRADARPEVIYQQARFAWFLFLNAPPTAPPPGASQKVNDLKFPDLSKPFAAPAPPPRSGRQRPELTKVRDIKIPAGFEPR